MKFIHTADWQLGKPFARIADPYKRSLVQRARIEVLARIADFARAEDAAFIVVAGDLFDSPSADQATVAEACSAIGHMGIRVYAIPGNHDHGGPGSLWEQPFFQRESRTLAPNLTVILSPEPLELDEVVLLPCPLRRRQESGDPTEWLRHAEVLQRFSPSKPRIVVAHGSTQDFTEVDIDEELGTTAPNRIDLSRLPMDDIDYVALGDWHGVKAAGPKAWYSGTPELDRFPKGEGHQPGHVLVVEPRRGGVPIVRTLPTAKLGWSSMPFEFVDDAGVDHLASRIQELVGQRANQDLLHLSLSGSLGLAAAGRLDQMLLSLEARLLRLKVEQRTTIAPSPDEIQALTRRPADPLISIVARQLVETVEAGDAEAAATAAIALRELHAACLREDRA